MQHQYEEHCRLLQWGVSSTSSAWLTISSSFIFNVITNMKGALFLCMMRLSRTTIEIQNAYLETFWACQQVCIWFPSVCFWCGIRKADPSLKQGWEKWCSRPIPKYGFAPFGNTAKTDFLSWWKIQCIFCPSEGFAYFENLLEYTKFQHRVWLYDFCFRCLQNPKIGANKNLNWSE